MWAWSAITISTAWCTAWRDHDGKAEALEAGLQQRALVTRWHALGRIGKGKLLFCAWPDLCLLAQEDF
jgi:hypothetical protein